jgi:hypothetical protein
MVRNERDRKHAGGDMFGFCYNALQTLPWYNPLFTRELEEEVEVLRDRYPNYEFVVAGRMNRRVALSKANLPHIADGLEEADEERHSQFGSRSSKDKIRNSEGKKLTKFCERNIFDILNRKYDSDAKGEFTFVDQLGKAL